MRGPVAGIVLGYLLFFVYGSLVPLHFTPQPLGAAWEAFWAAPGPAWRGDERVDIAVNFLLTVPLAFGFAHFAATARAAWRRWAGWLATAPVLVLLSVAVEFTQTFFPPRDPSWTDVAAQCGGTVAGLLIYALAGRRFRVLLDGLGRRVPAPSRLRLWLGLYLLLLLAFNVMPLDLSISPVELYRKWRDGRVVLVPFGSPWPGIVQFAYDTATDILLWVPVGWLWRGEGKGLRTVVLRTMLAAAAVECAQLLVLSRVSDVTDVLLAGFGGALGATLPHGLQRFVAWPTERRVRWLGAAWWLWLAVAVLLLWLPFDFDFDRDILAAGAQALTRPPFETYFDEGEFRALNEILRKLLVFLPGGLLVGARSLLGVRRPGLATMWLLAFGLEAGQLLLPTKVADLTDAVLGGCGAWIGWRLIRSLAAGATPLAAAPAAKAASPAAARRVEPATVAPPPRGLQPLLVLLLGLMFWVAGHLPGLPYNIAKLFPAGVDGIVSAAGLGLAVWWLLVAPLWLLAPQRQAWRALFALLLPLHALVSFALLRSTVPLAMIYKVIGNPTLGWDGPWEDIGRFAALHACVLLPLLGANFLVRTVQQPRAAPDLLLWALVSVVLFWPLHWVVVEQAGTDNLVELMRGGGSVGASLALGGAWLLVAAAGAAVGAALSGRRRALLLTAAAAIALAPLLFAAGLEPALTKYERTFSALQFIVSQARDRYASGGELALRAAAALALMVLVVAALQALSWRTLAAADALARQRRRSRTHTLAAA